MANTIKIQDTLNWLLAYTVQRPNTGVAQIANEPGLTAANKVMQTIMAPPLKWSWNPIENSSIVCTPGITDYTVSLPTWGWLEKALGFLSTNTPPAFEIEVYQLLSKEFTQNRPQEIAPIFDDNAGNITFRMMPPPDQAYQFTLTIQKAAVFAVSLGNTTWAPIPDRYAFLYEQGMMALIKGMYNEQFYFSNWELFLRSLVGASEGLTETEKAIFLEDQLRIMRTGQSSALGTSQGRQARI